MHHAKNGVIYQGKYKTCLSKLKCVEQWYRVQDDSDVAHNDVNFVFTTQFTCIAFLWSTCETTWSAEVELLFNYPSTCCRSGYLGV